ncbi:STAS domain-containing protein [Methanoplanus limicola]|uniref:Anti-sigma-factor antagonist n=1 Tax=Methanoplanus limicola DSM 2279 TaxID=937775 RepID=H1Z2K8_9EURY|nr:STAS domain-containing protein [Methanoplanus limicola]EHQ35534.1 anti-sigma-factor antagonist [Methanoplanus limicola DSM 2279]
MNIMEINRKKSEPAEIIMVKGRIDAQNSSILDEYLKEAIESGSEKIIINMNEVDYISSSGLRVMLLASKKVKLSGGDIKLSGLKPFVMDVFVVSGFNNIFDFYDSDNEALSDFIK